MSTEQSPYPSPRKLANTLYEQGASIHLLRVLMWDDGTDRRNSTREVVRRAYRLTEGDQAVPDEGDLLTRLERICGDFTHALINGEMDEAWYRADGSNTYILSDLYDEWEMDLYLDRKQLPRAFKTERSLHPSWTGGDA